MGGWGSVGGLAALLATASAAGATATAGAEEATPRVEANEAGRAKERAGRAGQAERVEGVEGAGVGLAPEARPPDDASLLASLGIELPQVTPGEELTLAEALRSADRRNLTLQAIRLELDKVQAQFLQTWALVLPAMQGQIQYVRADQEDKVDFGASMAPLFDALGLPVPQSDPVVVRRYDDVKGTLSLRVPLVDLKSGMTIWTAWDAKELARLSIEDARQQLLVGVAQAYYMAVMAGHLVALQEGQVVSAAHHLRVARARAAAGSGLRLDVVRAETDLVRGREELANAHLALDKSRDALAVLSGLDGLPLPNEPPALAVPAAEPAPLVEAARRDRVDLRLKRASVRLFDRRLQATWMQFLPTLDFVWAGSYQFTEPSSFGATDRARWNALLTLTVPLTDPYHGGELYLLQASKRQAELQARDAEAQLGLEVRQALRDHQTALATEVTAQQQAVLAAEGLSLALAAYEAGAGSSLDVTEGRRTAAATSVNVITARLRTQLALLVLLRASGADMLALPTQ